MTPPFTRILVLPRSQTAVIDLPAPYAVLSICDRGDNCPAKRRWGLRGVLTLHFADVDGPDGGMSPADARAVWAFVAGLPDEVETLVIHCFAGVSRSVSVAMALADVMGLGRACIDWRRMPEWASVYDDAPNGHVYKMMTEGGGARTPEE